LLYRHRRGESNLDTPVVDREHPTCANGVPVQLVVVWKESNLASGAVAQRERVVSRHTQEIVIARIDADAVGDRLGKVRFWLPVAPDIQQFEPDYDTVPISISVTSWKVAKYSTTYLAAFGPYGNPLCDVNTAVSSHVNADII
jgi:hypothetical protein